MTKAPVRSLRVIGLLSGTSIDGIDVAAAELDLTEDTIQLTPLGYTERPYPAELRAALHAALPPGDCTAERLCQLDTEVGMAFAEAANQGIAELADGRADLVASLGQTLHHWVEDGRCRGTLQIGQPAWIAEATGLPVVSDLRARDVAAGGHGAPLASTLDALWLRELAERAAAPAAALNIGGIANITVVAPGKEPLAYDTGPGNALLDAAAYLVTDGAQRQDTGGELAMRGSTRQDLLDWLLADPYYAAPAPKSTGKEYFHAEYLRRALAAVPPVSDADLLRTLVELTARTIAAECQRHGVRSVLSSGGGMHNPALTKALTESLGAIELRGSDELGLPTEAKEAYLTSLLGWLTWCGVPASLPSATGARAARLLGSITPGRVALAPPPAPEHEPRLLRVSPEHAAQPSNGR
ncbi:anhydro-N-acetylmuramic acid kinase [Tamaricihabitans halophyticus]|uniref:Anhydro-N-acetylmuramic acid kinase n=1 Tax=Tamaricihabitans halophyticus TaxID=1262583 RepID=A0A4R2QQJ4_9PSEU|nr:anhydro-N-acetylmuramic acid kinase [Tamaricihabitans halophyticus]TCP52000.1 anhydro-N-acetylmuramic acid kinase [Tamaricihabitans halophyticus]